MTRPAEIETLVASGSLGQLHALLRQICLLSPSQNVEPLRRELVLHSLRITDLERATRNGTARHDDLEITRNRLAASLIELADEIGQAIGGDQLHRHANAQAVLSRPAPSLSITAGTAPGAIAPIDVFLSYAHVDRERAQALAADLAARGVAVWFDVRITGGERFTDVIVAALDRAHGVVVLWTPAAVKSDWVTYEAHRAHRQGKHIPLIDRRLTIDDLPPPYPAILHAIPIDDFAQLTAALLRLQVAYSA
jgi:hypothetical protein